MPTRMRMDDSDEDHDTAYEYPDPELFRQGDGYCWPTADVDADGNPNNPELRAVSSALRDVWPEGDGSEDQSSDNQALPTWRTDGLETDYRTDQDDQDSESQSSSESEIDPPLQGPLGRRGRPRGRPRGSRGSRGGRGGRRPLTGDGIEDNSRNLNRGKRGRGRRNGRTTAKRGIRKALAPSDEFSRLQSEATKFFVEGNYDKAEALANQAVVENPEQFSAHSLLSEIFYERGDIERSVAALFAGAHVQTRDPQVWERSAELILERSSDLPMHKMLEDAVYCYTRVLSLEKERTDIRLARAKLQRKLGRLVKALSDLHAVLKRTPYDIPVIKMAIEVAVEMKKTQDALGLYARLIDILRQKSPQIARHFTWTDLYIYGELLTQLDKPAESIAKMKRIARWICGRGTDDYWEFQTQDDCEFDVDVEPRRMEVQESADTSYDNYQYGEALPLEIRIQLGILRLQSGDVDEAMRHIQFLRPADDASDLIEDFPDLFRIVGEALREKKLFVEALMFLEPLKNLDDMDSSYYAHLAFCYRQLGRFNEAETCYRTLIKHNESDAKSRKEMVDMFHAAEMQDRAAPYEHELLQKKRRQYRPIFTRHGLDDRVAYGAVQSEPEQPVAESGQPPAEVEHPVPQPEVQLPAKTPEPPKQIPNEPITASIEKEESVVKKKKHRQHHRKKAKESEVQEDFQLLFLDMTDLKKSFEAGDSDARNNWIQSARMLLRTFREMRIFFPYDRNVKFYGYTAEAQAKSLRPKAKQLEIDMELAEMLNVPLDQLPQDNIPNEFCFVPFDDWLDVFLQLAIMMGEEGKRQDCYSILDVLGACNIFYGSKEYMFRITIVGGICALLLDDDEKVGTVGRHVMTANQFNSDAYRLYAALFRICPRPNMSWFNSGVLQKFVMRQIKAVDFSVARISDMEAPITEEPVSLFAKDPAGNPILATRFDIPLLFLYGQILYAAGSYTYAMNYFYRARSLDATHPLINLSLGLSYIHHALTRQSLNRHQIIMQGLVFLFQYHDRRMQSEVIAEQQEATYNIGRAFHLLGLAHLAIPRYEKVLQLSEQLKAERKDIDTEDKNHENFAVDAAFALQGLYALAGNMRRAKELVDIWMVL